MRTNCQRRPCRTTRWRRARPGFSLLELMLVLAVLVVLGAFIWPLTERPMSAERLRQAADQVRAEWTRARVRAMTSGLPQVFRYEPETGFYLIETWAGLDVELEASDATAYNSLTAMGPGGQPMSLLRQKELPEGVAFFNGLTELDSRGMSLAAMGSDPSGVGGGGTMASGSGMFTAEPLFFYPDGTTSTATLMLRNDFDLYVTLQLRGLTGVTTISDLLAAEELPQ